MDDPSFTSRRSFYVWARQRLRYPDPMPGADARAWADIRRVAHAHPELFKGPHHD